MKLELKLKFFCPIKSLKRMVIPVSSVVNYSVDIGIEGNLLIFIEQGVAQVEADLELSTLNRWIPDAILSLRRFSLGNMINSKVIAPMKERGLLIEHELLLDSKKL